MSEHEIEQSEVPVNVKKIWTTPEIRDQSIKSATTKIKLNTTGEPNTLSGNPS